MNAHDPGLGLHSVQCGNIAIADEPFGIVLYGFKVNDIYKLDGAVTAAVAENRLDASILESLDKVIGTFFGSASVLACVELAHVLADNRLKAPFLDDVCRLLNVGIRREIRWRKECYLIAFFQECRSHAFSQRSRYAR